MSDTNDVYDIVIVGAGPAGMSAGLYASRAGYKTLMLEMLSPGGQMMLTDVIDNYPGFPEGITGFELQENMLKQAKKFGLEQKLATVKSIKGTAGDFEIEAGKNPVKARSVIIATGATHRHLGCPGEKEFTNKGVTYCATCDGPFYKDKDVVVVGGGDTALTEALFLAKIVKSVKIIHRRNRFRGVKSLVDSLAAKDNVEFVFNSVCKEIKGDRFVTSITAENSETGEESEISCDGVFIFVGLIPNTSFADKGLVDNGGYISTDQMMLTSTKGIYAAGDVRSNTFRQIVCAASDGAKAAQYAGEFVDELKGEAYN